MIAIILKKCLEKRYPKYYVNIFDKNNFKLLIFFRINMEELIYKVAIIGEIAVGKTTALARFVSGRFVSDTRSTIGVDFSLKHLVFNLDDTNDVQTEITLQIWDIAGESRFRELLPYYVTGIKGIILTFDSTSMKTLDSLHDWITVIGKHLNLDNMPLILISTKHDLDSNIDHDAVKTFCDKYVISDYFQTSSVSGKNIETVFRNLSELILNPPDIKRELG
ncbi:MAG: Transforming protein p29 precursor [Candidatus Heimdallarchaeota archaeon LC_3]|nr:MAG: Transforming protein p29 precursor [Candidatus Heimdallarchaeota archaeon LC_3]